MARKPLVEAIDRQRVTSNFRFLAATLHTWRTGLFSECFSEWPCTGRGNNRLADRLLDSSAIRSLFALLAARVRCRKTHTPCNNALCSQIR